MTMLHIQNSYVECLSYNYIKSRLKNKENNFIKKHTFQLL